MATHAHRLYLVRHAIAGERGPQWPNDEDRPITKDGASRMREIVKGFSRLDESIDLILTSPLVRARQTADILAAGLSPAPTVKAFAALAPGGTPPQIAAALGALRTRAQGIALVGHEPGLGLLAAWLINARTPPPFKKGGICRIDLDDWPPARSGRLIWLATPRMLRR
jgi:phosphohistidine phosphatase